MVAGDNLYQLAKWLTSTAGDYYLARGQLVGEAAVRMSHQTPGSGAPLQSTGAGMNLILQRPEDLTPFISEVIRINRSRIFP
jgi:hypothetical protein